MKYLRNNKLLLLIIGVLLIANVTMLYFHVWKKKPGPKRYSDSEIRERAKSKLKKEVGFTEAQLAQYDTLRTKHFESMKPLFESLRASKDSFYNLLYSAPAADSLIETYSMTVSEKQRNIDVKMLRYFRSLKEICSDEQKPKMDSFLKNITNRMYRANYRRGQDHKK